MSICAAAGNPVLHSKDPIDRNERMRNEIRQAK
jgi:hypothetical protein